MTIEQQATEQSATTPRNVKMLIGGEQVDALDGQTFEAINPATGEVIANVPLGGKADVDRAVEAAQKAFEGPYSKWSAAKRGRTLQKFADLVKKNIEELAQIDRENVGKPITASRGESFAVSLVLEYYAGAANKHFGETIPTSMPGFDFTLREPIGVVGMIVPWNFPLNMAAWKLGPALATGNTCIIKPASWTPLSAIRLAELALEAGFPPGVVNVVTGPGGTVGAALAAHPGVGKVAFTGETTTGQEIMRLAANNVKKISLELGGKSPNIVFADADLEKFAAAAPMSVFDNAGQNCTRAQPDPGRAIGPRSRGRALRASRPPRWWSATRPTTRPRSAAWSAAPARAGAGVHRLRAGGGRAASSAAAAPPDDAAWPAARS